MAVLSFLDKDRSVAGPGYNRWLAPPAALAIHLSIGQVYAWSVFNIPLAQLVGGAKSAPGDWTRVQVGWTFSIAIAVLGLTAAFMGKWLERNGPRKAMVIAALCFGGGFEIAALGVHLHQIALLYLGYGVVGGFGLGLGYLAPVANLVRWFNDRPGLATGMAIMGFGGGAMVGSPLAKDLMAHFAPDAAHLGVAPAMVVMGAVYGFAMLFGAAIVRVPPADYRPAGAPAAPKVGPAPTTPGVSSAPGSSSPGPASASPKGNVANIPFAVAVRTPQFWLLWVALCVNTTAGISILEKASPLIIDFFGKALGPTDKAQSATAAGFVGFISLFNAGGRFAWSTVSDYLGRKATFAAFFLLGIPLYALLTRTDAHHLNSVVLFVAIIAVLLSIYGGGFATMPAYLRDVFGTKDLNAIYGLMLTAWSVAGVLGPQLVNGLSDHLINTGTPSTNAYATVYYVMSGLLAVGLVCDLLVRPVKADVSVAGDVPAVGPVPAGDH
jgi:MFS family permease